MNNWSKILFPESLMALSVVLAVILDLVTPMSRKRTVAGFAVTAVLSILGFVLASDHIAGGISVEQLFTADSFTLLARFAILVATALALLAAAGSRSILVSGQLGVVVICLLSLGLGAMVFAGASNLLTIFIGLEVMSLPSYVLAGLDRRDRTASEAGMKYVMYGALASGLSLFGMSLLYGLSGTLELVPLGAVLCSVPPAVIAGPLLLAAAGLAYKLALVPFHAYAPDVYQGAHPVSAGVFSVIPKLAAFALLMRVVTLLVPPALADTAAVIFVLVGTVTLLVGAIAALAQKDVQRILAYSAIGHAGTMLLAFAVWPDRSALAALAWYLLAYLFMNLGAFTAVGVLVDEGGKATLASLAGTWKRRPWVAAALVLSLVSLAGIPPLAGFFAKWLLVRELVVAGLRPGNNWLLAIALTLLLGAVIAAVAYLRIVRSLFASAEDDGLRPDAVSIPTRLVLLICAGANLFLGLALPLVDWLRRVMA